MNKSKGFTLIEVIIVIMIIGIVAAITVPLFSESTGHKLYMGTCLQEAELTVEDCKANADYLYPPEQSSSSELRLN
jgi:prepilin-type N-terminal cleavage/methylation domain-containing protein